MHGNDHRGRGSGKTLMAMTALVLLLAAVSHAQVPLDQLTTQPLDTTLGLVVDTEKKDKDKDKDKGDKKPVSVPEPSATLLLLMGLGVAALAGGAVPRRQRRA